MLNTKNMLHYNKNSVRVLLLSLVLLYFVCFLKFSIREGFRKKHSFKKDVSLD